MMAEPDTRLIERVLMDDPSMTDAELVYQRAKRPGDPTVGKSSVDRNMLSVIGGLAYIHRRLRHHEKAAEWWRAAYETTYGSVSGGVDLEAVRVDRSIIAHDAGMARRIDFGRDLRGVVMELGGPVCDVVRLLTAVVVFEQSIREFAGDDASGYGRVKLTKLLLDALDKVAALRGFVMEAR